MITLPFKKFRQRLLLFGMSAAYNLVPMVFNVVLAAIVIRLLSAALWGEMVQVLLWTGIAGNIMAWGNKDYLVRSFSIAPSSISQSWQRSFGSRSLLAVAMLLLLLFIPLPLPVMAWTSLLLMARFFYLSYDALIVFKRNFITTLLLESAGFIFIGAGIIYFPPAGLPQLLCWFACADLLKSAAVIFLFRKAVLPVLFRDYDSRYFKLAFSFFLLYFTGMLATKVDLICITTLFDKAAIARYQVLMSFLQATQLFIPILLIPYLSFIYRLPVASVRKMALRLFIVGMLIAAIAVFSSSVLLSVIYRFQYQPAIFFLGWLMVIPGFYFAPLIYRLFKNNRQHLVVLISLFFILLTVALIYTLVTVFPEPLTAIFIALAAAQWIQGIIYFFAGKKLT